MTITAEQLETARTNKRISYRCRDCDVQGIGDSCWYCGSSCNLTQTLSLPMQPSNGNPFVTVAEMISTKPDKVIMKGHRAKRKPPVT